MKYLNVIVISLFFLASCGEGTDNSNENGNNGTAGTEDFQTSDKGLEYVFLKKNEEGKKANINDVLSMRVEYKNVNGKSLFNSRTGPTGMMRMQLTPPAYGGDINEGLAMMAEGDSAIFLVPSDSFFIHNMRGQRLPDSLVPAGSKLRFEVQMVEVKSLEEVQAEQKEKNASAMQQEQATIDKYLAENNITQEPTESGLIFIQDKKGTGAQAKAGDVVKVHYTGMFLDGTKFDSSVDRGDPLQFQLGMGSVIRGWDEGIAMMKEGGKATLIVPSIIAYGERGSQGAIPPFSPLKFEVELIEVRDK